MGLILKETLAVRNLLFPITGETRVKTFFSYYGIFKDNLMFALYKQGAFYLRISPNTRHNTDWLKPLQRLEDHRIGIHYKHFYLIPNHILSDLSQYSHFIAETLEDISESKKQTALQRKKLLRTLPNLSIGIERMLKRLGIYSVDEFFEWGEMNICVALVQKGVEVSPELLFKLYGATHHQHVYTMSGETKLAILQEADKALYAAGLRKRFSVGKTLGELRGS